MSLQRLTQQWLQSAPSHCYLLVPTNRAIPGLKEPRVSPVEYRVCLENVQRFRGKAYVTDGAVTEQQLSFGRWIVPEDKTAWHLVVCDRSGIICGVIWYQPNPVPRLKKLHCYHPETSTMLQQVREEARLSKRGFAEMGGWVASSSRANLLLLLLVGTLHRWIDGGLAAVIITLRRHANQIIRCLGGQSLAEPYFDKKFGCLMELLILDSQDRSTTYEAEAELVSRVWPEITIIAREAA